MNWRVWVEIFSWEKRKRREKETGRDKGLCHGLSRLAPGKDKWIEIGPASRGRHGRVRGVNRLPSKRSFVRSTASTKPARFVSSERFMSGESTMRVNRKSRCPLFPPASFLRKRRRRKAPFIALFSSPTRPVYWIGRSNRGTNWIPISDSHRRYRTPYRNLHSTSSAFD